MTTQREWECPECGQVFRGQNPPDECPVCGEPLSDVDLYDLEEQDDWLSDDPEDDPLDNALLDVEAVLPDDEDVDAALSPDEEGEDHEPPEGPGRCGRRSR